MIQFATDEIKPLVREMWKECFDDNDEFLDLYFTYKYKNENTLVYTQGKKVAASLQMFPYYITFYNQKIPFYYLAGLCTLPEYRKMGYMAQLIYTSHECMKKRAIPLSILVPAEKWLFGFYEKYGYEQVFDGNDTTVPLQKILDNAADLNTAYKIFDEQIQNHDFYVQKDFEDFKIIVDEYEIDGCPTKYNLSAMACIINEDYLLDIYNNQTSYHGLPAIVKETGNLNRPVYIIKNGQNTINIGSDKRLLCRLLFGYKISKLEPPFSTLFTEHHPVINLMLE